QRLKPHSKHHSYRSAEALRHPKSSTTQNQVRRKIKYDAKSSTTQNQVRRKIKYDAKSSTTQNQVRPKNKVQYRVFPKSLNSMAQAEAAKQHTAPAYPR